MSMLVAERVERPPSLFGPAPGAVPAPDARDLARQRDGDLGGGLTLDDAIVGAWEGLAARVTVACPCCGGALRPRSVEDAGGRCTDCGTTLT